jgi:hypothetical protein
MLYMVIETMKAGPAAVGERFRASGRMMPDNISYVASWVEPDGSRCFQLMEASSREALQPWIDRWSDLVDFEVRAVQPSAEFWSTWNDRHIKQT